MSFCRMGGEGNDFWWLILQLNLKIVTLTDYDKYMHDTPAYVHSLLKQIFGVLIF